MRSLPLPPPSSAWSIPPTLVLIVLALGGKALHRRCWIHRMAALGALAVSLLEVIGTYTGLR